MIQLNFQAVFQKIRVYVKLSFGSVMGELSFNYCFYQNSMITILLRVSFKDQTFRHQKLMKFEFTLN